MESIVFARDGQLSLQKSRFDAILEPSIEMKSLVAKSMSKVDKVLTMLKEDGLAYIVYKLRKKLARGKKKPLYTAAELEQQGSFVFSRKLKVSVLVPLYNTPEKLLREMIDSVVAQTYGAWELCLADGSDEAHGYVGEICAAYAKADSRICYKKLAENKGISGNTNACIEMATGEYIALFDHDDLLHPAALYEVMTAICEQGADFIYTDEDMFYETPADAYSPHYKPDFSPDTLRSYNYITHLSVFSRELLEKVGGFRSEFDGSQDYDMILRLTEQAERIVHIPKILYYWRNHAGSVASNVSVKPYTMTAAKKALAEHLQRIGRKGTVEDSSVLTTYHIQYELDAKPLVSVMLSYGDRMEWCKNHIQQISTYSNLEVVTNGQPNGEYIVLLDSDTEVITPDWIEQMLMYAQREDVGAVGAMIWSADDTVYSAGKILGVKGTVGDSHRRYPKGHDGYKFRMTVAQNYSAVSDVCMMVRKDVFERMGYFDASFGAFADVDFCLRLREAGYLVVWTPYAEVRYHAEPQYLVSKESAELFRARWNDVLEQGDPYYNPNLILLRADFGEKI